MSFKVYVKGLFLCIIIFNKIKEMRSFQICDEFRKPLVPCQKNQQIKISSHVICDNYNVN